MKKWSAAFLLALVSVTGIAQKAKDQHTLLWKITGPGLAKPSYLFGTIHMLCKDDAVISPNLQKAIEQCDDVYFEVDMDNIMEMLGAIGKMKMKGDVTLRDLLTPEEYTRVKNYFESKGSMLPFSVLETYKPMLAASTLEEGSIPCENTAMMEQVIMEEAKENRKSIKGLETMSYQAGVLDSIPYALQAKQLLDYIDKEAKGEDDGKEIEKLFKAYKSQDLDKLEELMVESDAGMAGFTDIMLYHRNQNWVNKLKDLLTDKSLVIAVGAGHLPGKKGVIELLRKAGYTLTPVENRTSPNHEI